MIIQPIEAAAVAFMIQPYRRTVTKIVFPLVLLIAVAGEVSGREGTKQAQAAPRDATVAQRRTIEEKYDALIAEAQQQIRGLTALISRLDWSIDGLKQSSAKLVGDYKAWASNAQRASDAKKAALAAQAKSKELESKLGENDKMIQKYQQEKQSAQYQIQELKKNIVQLEKEKEVTLKKLK